MISRNIFILFFIYAIAWCVMAIAFSATASVGHQLAPDKSLILLPLIMQVFGAVAISFPASLIMRTFGRRKGFMIGGVIGAVGATLCAYSIFQQNFWMLICSTPILGMFNGFGELAKFAAAEVYDDKKQQSRAISIVVSGGIVAAFIGPTIAAVSNSYFAHLGNYFGPYSAALGLCSLSFLLATFLRRTNREWSQGKDGVETTVRNSQVLRNPVFIVATASAAVGYLVMSAIMDGMPITMLENDMDFSDTTVVLQWHMLAMFAPSYLTARIIEKYGIPITVFAGIGLNVVGLISALSGVEFHHFWIGLFAIGLGWNLMYLGGTNLLTHIAEDEKPKAEGMNNFVIMGCFAISAPIVAVILNYFGWPAVSYFSLALLLVAAALNLNFVRTQN
ncbi:MAG: MFS transporter [Pseudomonadota bacterium]